MRLKLQTNGTALQKYPAKFFNVLKELPPEIGQLTSLQKLDLGSNSLRELPKEIGQLKNIEFGRYRR